ncbi:DUF2561 family protein [Mycolicibacter longobardus]|uniref:DUF2561 domain-containing protein n=1 Tax=Mycolicibacter longobardus TaxID=1108812 RepID=A0A1X1YMQ9_9MYCO|nr:DUF2561 family protein [Mycolicibacter longobardus]MCV7385218.1 DUF2561 family protein [Mycolicibacter longobardus]ORW12378.1 hypothetical protein AWC16_08180 [Mycolicibacter longobardus]
MVSRNIGDRFFRTGQSPEVVDRVLLGVCAAIWLSLLGMSVAALVALVDLGRGFDQPAESSHTGLLYIVIGVSALVILAAIPVLLRARQTGAPRPPGFAPQAQAKPPRQGGPLPQRGFDAPGRRAAATRAPLPNQAQVDRVLLRGVTVLASAVGGALTVVALATYLMATGKDTGSWVCYGLAGAITLAMPVIPWLYLRRLGEVLELPSRFG